MSKKQNLSNGELVKKLQETLAELEIIKKASTPDSAWEFNVMEKVLLECIPLLDPYKKKQFVGMMFGILGETPTDLQIAQLQLNHDKKFDALQDQMNMHKLENKNQHRWLQVAFIALTVGSTVFGAIEAGLAESIIKFIFGW